MSTNYGTQLVFRTLEDAQANPRHGTTKGGETKPYELYKVVSPPEVGGKGEEGPRDEYFTWSDSYTRALEAVVREVGWTIGLAVKKGGKVDPASLSEEQLLAELERRGLNVKTAKKGGKGAKGASHSAKTEETAQEQPQQ